MCGLTAGPQSLSASSIQPPPSTTAVAASQSAGSVEYQPPAATDPAATYPPSQYSFYQQTTGYQLYAGCCTVFVLAFSAVVHIM